MAVAGTYRHVGILPSEPFFGSGFGLPLVVVDHADVSSVHVHQTLTSPSPKSLLSPSQPQQPLVSQSSVGVFKKSRPMDLLRWFSTYVWRCVKEYVVCRNRLSDVLCCLSRIPKRRFTEARYIRIQQE